jgi:hypothetical protein
MLADSILNDGPRGYQMADWHEALSLDRVREEWNGLRQTPLATESWTWPAFARW